MKTILKEIKLWYYRHFKIITLKQCYDFKLKFVEDIYGDSINYLNCRSIWKDNKERLYRCEELFSTCKLQQTKINKHRKEDTINLLNWLKHNSSFNLKDCIIKTIEQNIFDLDFYQIDCEKEKLLLKELKNN